MRASEVILVLEIKTEAGFRKSSVSFLSYRKLRFHTIKMLREDAHSAQGQMVAEHVFYCFTWKVRCDIMSTKEKQATPKAAFVFLVPLENEQPA